ncbi:MAG: kelch repeat-containing protein [Candidatus Diapherotrites archaeon]|nr:kelch repeat-containing protein [Candidatus Diapherotrites archaeon]
MPAKARKAKPKKARLPYLSIALILLAVIVLAGLFSFDFLKNYKIKEFTAGDNSFSFSYPEFKGWEVSGPQSPEEVVPATNWTFFLNNPTKINFEFAPQFTVSKHAFTGGDYKHPFPSISKSPNGYSFNIEPSDPNKVLVYGKDYSYYINSVDFNKITFYAQDFSLAIVLSSVSEKDGFSRKKFFEEIIKSFKAGGNQANGKLVYSDSGFVPMNSSGRTMPVESFEGIIELSDDLGISYFALVLDKNSPSNLGPDANPTVNEWNKRLGLRDSRHNLFSSSDELLKSLVGKRVKIEGILNESNMAPGRFIITKSIWLVSEGNSSPQEFEVRASFLQDLYYGLEIVRLSDNKVIQTISVRNAVDLTKPGVVELIDLNNDGFKDLRVIGGYDGKKPLYKVWYFDTKTQSFVWLEQKQDPVLRMPVRPNVVLNLWHFTFDPDDKNRFGFEVSIDGQRVESQMLGNDDSLTAFLILTEGKHKLLAVSYSGDSNFNGAFGRGIAFKKEIEINVQEGKMNSLDFFYASAIKGQMVTKTISRPYFDFVLSSDSLPSDSPIPIRGGHQQGQEAVLTKTSPNFVLEPPVGSDYTAAPAMKVLAFFDGKDALASNFALTLSKGPHVLKAEGIYVEFNETDYFEAFFSLTDEATYNYVYLDFMPLRSTSEDYRKVFASSFSFRIAQQQARFYQ